MNATALECGCYTSPQGRLTRCPSHDAQVELSMALADLPWDETENDNLAEERNSHEHARGDAGNATATATVSDTGKENSRGESRHSDGLGGKRMLLPHSRRSGGNAVVHPVSGSQIAKRNTGKNRAGRRAMTAKITIHTDGACSRNPGPGGFAAIIQWEQQEITVTGGEPESTNNRMELGAVIEALKYLAGRPESRGAEIEVRSDSTYVTNAFNKGWLRNWRSQGLQNRTNGDLWATLDQLVKDRKISWTWVKGHSGDRMNTRCDALAVEMTTRANEIGKYWTQVSAKGEEPAPDQLPAPNQTPAAQTALALNTETSVAEEPPLKEPGRGHPVKDALAYNSRAERLAKIILEKAQTGETEDAERALALTLDQLGRQSAILNKLLGGRPRRE